jgi:hypothetical protein
MAAEERFLIASSGGEVFAALEYRVEPPRLLLGLLVSNPLASEQLPARVLYAEAHAFARETGLEEVRAAPPVYGDYPYEVGRRRRHGCWKLEADTPRELRAELPEGGWRRVLALWGFTTNIGTLFAFVLVSVGVVVLRLTRPELPRAFRTPLVPLVPALAVLSCLYLTLNLAGWTWVRFFGWMAVGIVVYLLCGRTHSRLARGEPIEETAREV